MSWVMGVGFAGLLVIPPAVGYVSSAVGGSVGNVRTGLTAVIAASVAMFLLHALLLLGAWQGSRVISGDSLECGWSSHRLQPFGSHISREMEPLARIPRPNFPTRCRSNDN
jgi:hypothetical protein